MLAGTPGERKSAMNDYGLPNYILDRIRQRRGPLHVYETLDASKTALLVVDMQNAYVAPGAPSEIPAARDLVPNINRLATALREGGGRVVWIKNTLGNAQDDWPTYYHLKTPEINKRLVSALKEGSAGHNLWPQLAALDGDIVLNKYRYSAFHGTILDDTLRKYGITNVAISGVVTNVCCECTARDAMMRNFATIMVADGNASRTGEEHRATLANVLQFFGDVLSTDEILARLG